MSRFVSLLEPLAVVDLRGWPVEGAQCRFDPDLHTGPDGFESPGERAARELVAVEVCASCPLRAECLELAIAVRPQSGVWGGLTAAEIAESSALDLGEAA